MFRLTTLRAAAALAVLGAMALAGCGGGGSKSMGPLPALAAAPTMPTSNGGQVQMGTMSVTVPNHAGAATQSSQRAVLGSTTAKKPAFIDTTTLNSSIVVSVTPQNAAEQAQYGNLTVCYNLYVNGTLAPAAAPNFTYTNAGNTVTTVTMAIPAPPGTDGFQITQYAGLCGSTPYTVPTPPPGNVGASNVLVQTPVTFADIEPGVPNQSLNVQIAACPAQTVPCPLGIGPGPGALLTASVTVASIAFGGLPIASPVREQGAFLMANGKIGVPIPLEALDAAGAVIPGLTIGANGAGSGPFVSGVTITSNDATAHTHLFLVDATNGAIAQAAASNAAGLTIHEFNALSDGTIPNVPGPPAFVPSDITFGGSTAVGGHPWVIIMTSDGVAPLALPSVVVTATATIPPSATATTITTTITPQAAIYTAGGTGYPDTALPAAPSGLIAVGAVNYFTDGNTVKIDGAAPGVASAATALGGLTSATWPNATTFVYAVDSDQAAGTTPAEAGSGLYAFNAAVSAVVPVSAQAGANNYVQFANPVAVVQAQGGLGATHPYAFVVDKNGGIYRLDISGASELAPVGGFQEATNVLPILSVTGTALSPGTAKYLGTAALAGGQFLIGDPGNNRIAQVDATQSPAVITSWASGAPFTGVYLSGTSAYATSTTGQIYYISAAGATPVSLGFATGTAIDGPIGQIASFAPASTPTLTPVNYPLQFQSGSFFDQLHAFAGFAPYAALAAPYTIAPFPGGKAFAAAPAAGVGLIADTSAGGVTGAGLIKATGGIIVVPAATAASAVVTPDSILFVDSAGVGGKLRTIVR
jgi:hypothetical protein